MSPAVQPNPQMGQAASLGQFSGSMTPDQAQSLANQYLQAAGLPPDTGGMWSQYWTQFGSKDPNYFMTRLLNGMATQGGNMSQFQSQQSPTAPGGWGPGTSGFGGGGGSGGGAGGGSGGGFNFDPNTLANNPTYQFALNEALRTTTGQNAAKGIALSSGQSRDVAQNDAGVISQLEPMLYNQAQGTFQTNFGDLGNLTNLGYNASSQQGAYDTQVGNSQAAGSVQQGNIWGNAAQNAGNTIGNAYLYNQIRNGQQGGPTYAQQAANQTSNQVLGYG